MRLDEGVSLRFRCRGGHGYSAGALLDGSSRIADEELPCATRALEETVSLLDLTGAHFDEHGDGATARKYAAKARETELRAAVLRKASSAHESLSAESMRGG